MFTGGHIFSDCVSNEIGLSKSCFPTQTSKHHWVGTHRLVCQHPLNIVLLKLPDYHAWLSWTFYFSRSKETTDQSQSLFLGKYINFASEAQHTVSKPMIILICFCSLEMQCLVETYFTMNQNSSTLLIPIGKISLPIHWSWSRLKGLQTCDFCLVCQGWSSHCRPSDHWQWGVPAEPNTPPPQRKCHPSCASKAQPSLASETAWAWAYSRWYGLRHKQESISLIDILA